MKIVFFILLIQFTALFYCLNNGLAKTPQMGWNSWNAFHCNIVKKTIKFHEKNYNQIVMCLNTTK